MSRFTSAVSQQSLTVRAKAPPTFIACLAFSAVALSVTHAAAHGSNAHGSKASSDLTVYTEDYFRDKITLKGFRLGMPVEEAQARFGFELSSPDRSPNHLSVETVACDGKPTAVGHRLMAVGPEGERYSALFNADGLLQSLNVSLTFTKDAFPPNMNMAGVVASMEQTYGAPTGRYVSGDGDVRALAWSTEALPGFENDPMKLPSKGEYIFVYAAPVGLIFDKARQIYRQTQGEVFSVTLHAGADSLKAFDTCK